MVRIGDELYSKVKAPMDGLLDSRYLLNISDMGAEMTRTMRIDADAFDMDEYMQKVAHFIGGSTVAVSSRPDESADDMSQIFTGDTDTWNWDRLGLLAARHSRRAPVAEHLLGPLQVTPKHRKITRTSRLDADAEQVAPQRLDASAIIPSENETSRMVLDIALYWTKFSDNRGLIEAVHRMLETYPTRMICPAHGNVVTDPAELSALMDEAFLANGIRKNTRAAVTSPTSRS